jgi:hypothetical protein
MAVIAEIMLILFFLALSRITVAFSQGWKSFGGVNIILDTGFVTPVDIGLTLFGPGGKAGMSGFQPPGNLLRTLFVGSIDRLL